MPTRSSTQAELKNETLVRCGFWSRKGAGYMPTGLEITKTVLDDFKKIQEYMLLAKKENATETYAKLKDEYLIIKAMLNVAGVNLTDIDKIKE
jgi:hypothetical protein